MAVITKRAVNTTAEEDAQILAAWKSGRLNDRNYDYFLKQVQSDPKRDGAVSRALLGQGNVSRDLHEISMFFDPEILYEGLRKFHEEHGTVGMGLKIGEDLLKSPATIGESVAKLASGTFSDRPVSDVIGAAQAFPYLRTLGAMGGAGLRGAGMAALRRGNLEKGLERFGQAQRVGRAVMHPATVGTSWGVQAADIIGAGGVRTRRSDWRGRWRDHNKRDGYVRETRWAT